MNETHFKKLTEGVASFNEWRRGLTTHTILDLCGANLKGMSLKSVDLSKALLTEANLQDADLESANLQGAILKQARLDAVIFTNANLRGAHLSGAKLRNANLDFAVLDHADLASAELSGATGHKASFVNASLEGALMSDVVFGECNFCDARLNGAHLEQAILIMNSFVRADFSGGHLKLCQLTGSKLQGARFIRSDLSRANLLRVEVNGSTIFTEAQVASCEIERFTLLCLQDYGGLTQGDRMLMNTRDAVASLRSNYSGVIQWLHVAALILFVGPYVWFLVEQWCVIRLEGDNVRGITLLEALTRYIANGGVDWKVGWHVDFFVLGLFLFALLYNSLRAYLLFQTKKLELQEECTGLPAMVSLEGTPLGRLFRLASVLFLINLTVVLVHTLHFMMNRIPGTK